jgi:hypothetical protein
VRLDVGHGALSRKRLEVHEGGLIRRRPRVVGEAREDDLARGGGVRGVYSRDMGGGNRREGGRTLRMPVKSSSMLAVSGLGSVCTILSFSRSETRHEPWKKSGRLQYASGSARK